MRQPIPFENLDPALLNRISRLSAGGQRWLKTAIITMRTMPDRADESDTSTERQIDVPPQLRKQPRATTKRVPDMEDIITGKVDARELDEHPELAEQLEGMGEVIDMLRNLGEQRRKRGEQILREEILGGDGDQRRSEDDEDFNF